MKEVFASLYNDRAISYRVHKGFAHADVALSAGVQRMVRSDLGAAGVMFTIDTESRLPGRGVHHLQLRPGRDGGAGRGEPGRVLRAQADAARPASSPIIRRNLGSQADPHGVRHARRSGRQRPAGAHRGHAARAAQPLLAHRRRRDRAGALRADHRAALRPPDGHRVGQGRQRRQALHPAGPARDGEEPGRRQGRAALQAQGRPRKNAVLAEGRAIGQKIGTGPVRLVAQHRPRWTACSPATCWSPT